jgi:hypothetical protein
VHFTTSIAVCVLEATDRPEGVWGARRSLDRYFLVEGHRTGVSVGESVGEWCARWMLRSPRQSVRVLG